MSSESEDDVTSEFEDQKNTRIYLRPLLRKANFVAAPIYRYAPHARYSLPGLLRDQTLNSLFGFPNYLLLLLSRLYNPNPAAFQNFVLSIIPYESNI
jgi:hypothetical protein